MSYLNEMKSEKFSWFQGEEIIPAVASTPSFASQASIVFSELVSLENAKLSMKLIPELAPLLIKVPPVFKALYGILNHLDLTDLNPKQKTQFEECKQMLTQLGFWTPNRSLVKKEFRTEVETLRIAIEELANAIPPTPKPEAKMARNLLTKTSDIIEIVNQLVLSLLKCKDTFDQNNKAGNSTAFITLCSELYSLKGLSTLAFAFNVASPTLLWTRRMTLAGQVLPDFFSALHNRKELKQKITELIQSLQSSDPWPADSLLTWRLDCYRTLVRLIEDPLIFNMVFNVIHNISVEVARKTTHVAGSTAVTAIDAVTALQYLQYLPYLSYMGYFAVFANPQAVLVKSTYTVANAIIPQKLSAYVNLAELATHVLTLSPLEALSASRGLAVTAVASVKSAHVSNTLITEKDTFKDVFAAFLKGVLFNKNELEQFTNGDPFNSLDCTTSLISITQLETLIGYFNSARNFASFTQLLGKMVAYSSDAGVDSQKQVDEIAELKALKLDTELESLWNPSAGSAQAKPTKIAKFLHKLFKILGAKIFENPYFHCKCDVPSNLASLGASVVSTTLKTVRRISDPKVHQLQQKELSVNPSIDHHIVQIEPASDGKGDFDEKQVGVDYNRQLELVKERKKEFDTKKEELSKLIDDFIIQTDPAQLETKYKELYQKIVKFQEGITAVEKSEETLLCYQARLEFNRTNADQTTFNYKKECMNALLTILLDKLLQAILTRILADAPQFFEELSKKSANEQMDFIQKNLFDARARQSIFLISSNAESFPLEGCTPEFYSSFTNSFNEKLVTEKNKFESAIFKNAFKKLQEEYKNKLHLFSSSNTDKHAFAVFNNQCQAFRKKIYLLSREEQPLFLAEINIFEEKIKKDIQQEYQNYISKKLGTIFERLVREAIALCDDKNAEQNPAPFLQKIDPKDYENYALIEVFPSYKDYGAWRIFSSHPYDADKIGHEASIALFEGNLREIYGIITACTPTNEQRKSLEKLLPIIADEKQKEIKEVLIEAISPLPEITTSHPQVPHQQIDLTMSAVVDEKFVPQSSVAAEISLPSSPNLLSVQILAPSPPVIPTVSLEKADESLSENKRQHTPENSEKLSPIILEEIPIEDSPRLPIGLPQPAFPITPLEKGNQPLLKIEEKNDQKNLGKLVLSVGDVEEEKQLQVENISMSPLYAASIALSPLSPQIPTSSESEYKYESDSEIELGSETSSRKRRNAAHENSPPVTIDEIDSLLDELDELKESFAGIDLVCFAGDDELEKLRKKPDIKKIKSLHHSLTLALAVASNPYDEEAIENLRTDANNHAIGKPNFGKKFVGALLDLAGSAMLVVAHTLLTDEAKTVMYIGGSLLMAGGTAFFYNGLQKGVAKTLSKLANNASQLDDEADESYSKADNVELGQMNPLLLPKA